MTGPLGSTTTASRPCRGRRRRCRARDRSTPRRASRTTSRGAVAAGTTEILPVQPVYSPGLWTRPRRRRRAGSTSSRRSATTPATPSTSSWPDRPCPWPPPRSPSSLGLHVNTVRPHLERMREVGLLEVAPDHRGAPGRPQHRYSLAAGAPSLGLEPPTFPVLARMLLGVAARAGRRADDAAAAGREQGDGRGAARARRRAVRRCPRRAARPPRVRPDAGRRRAERRRSASPTAPSASWPRRTPSWCAGCTGASSRASSTASAAPTSSELRDPRRPPAAGSPSPTGNLLRHDHADRRSGHQGQGPHRGRG